MRLQLNRALGEQRPSPVPEVLDGGRSTTSLSLSQTHVRSPTCRIRKRFHSPKGLSARTSGSFPGARDAVLPQAAGALVGAEVPLAPFFRVIPDLNLGAGPQVNPAVGQATVL